MASEIRVNKINNRAGLGTITIADTGVVVNGIVTCTEVSGLNVLNIAGVSTFASTLDINGDIDVDGHTNLDNLSVAGVSTFNDNVRLLDGDRLQFGNSQDISIFHNGSHTLINKSGSGTGDLIFNIDQVIFKDTTGSDERLATNSKGIKVGTGVTIETNGQATYTGIVTATSYRGDGSQLTGIVAGLSTISGVVNVANDLDVDGHTELDNLRVTGITTIRGDIRKPYGTYHPMLTIRNAAAGSAALRIDNWSNNTSEKRINISYNFNRLSSAFAADDSSIGCASIAFEDGEIRFGTSAAGTNNSQTRYKFNSSGHFIPNADSTFDIGTNSVRVRNVYADTYYGDGANLTNLPAGAPVGGASTNTVFFENDVAVAVNYQVTTNKNAMSAGPIAINAGIAVTVPSGSSWTIV